MVNDYIKCLSIDPFDPIVHYNLAQVQIHFKDYNGAIVELNKAISLDSNYGDALFKRGLIYILNNNDYYSGCQDLSRAGELGISEAYNYISKYCR